MLSVRCDRRMRFANSQQSRQSNINHGSSSATANPSQPFRTSTHVEPNENVREHSFADNYELQGLQSYANGTINPIPNPEIPNTQAIRSDHQMAFKPMNNSTSNLYPTPNLVHSFPIGLHHPAHDMYNYFQAGQSQSQSRTWQTPHHHHFNLTNLYHQDNLEASQASQPFCLKRPTVCVCGMMG